MKRGCVRVKSEIFRGLTFNANIQLGLGLFTVDRNPLGPLDQKPMSLEIPLALTVNGSYSSI